MHYTNKKFSIKNFKKIYLMIPANVSTGGPEALHQLGNILKNDLKILISIRKQLKETGNIYLFLPAKKILWSKLDEVVGHYRRYEISDVLFTGIV